MVGIYNVKEDFGAAGDGIKDDTASIQAALDAAESAGGGVVFLPTGNYTISSTLLLPNKVYLQGVGATTFGAGNGDISQGPAAFLPQVNTYITWNGLASEDMITQKGVLSNGTYDGVTLYETGVEKIVLYGNKSGGTGRGINIKDASSSSQYSRSHFILRDVIIYWVNGIGFYDGENQNEIFFDNVYIYGCGATGLFIKGQDIKVFKVGCGGNSGNGIEITGGGAVRMFDVDSWSNVLSGIAIYDVLNIEMFGVQCNDNQWSGLNVYSNTFPPGQIQVYRGGFGDNSQAGGGLSPDVLVSSNLANGMGPYNLVFIGCVFVGRTNASGPRPSYPIMDISGVPAPNLVSNCFFHRSQYAFQQLGAPSIYKFQNNYDYDLRENLDELNLSYAVATIFPYTLTVGTTFLKVSPTDSGSIVNLPETYLTRGGKIIIISNSNSQTSVELVPSGSDIITGPTEVGGPNNPQAVILINSENGGWYSTGL